MIYSSYKDVATTWDYAKKEIAQVHGYAVNYLRDVVEEVGAICVTIQQKACLLTKYQGDIVLFECTTRFRPLLDVSVEDIVKLSEQVHELHLVEEWREKYEAEKAAEAEQPKEEEQQ